MSGAQPSPFLTTNELLAPMAAYDAHSNALLTAQHNQQQIGSADIEMVARAASPLLNMKEEEAAAAYPGVIASLKAQGFGKYAPATYPGHAVTQHLVSMGIPAEKQWERSGNQATIGSMYTPPSGDGTTGAAPAPSPGSGQPSVPIPARGTGGPGASASMPPEYLDYFRQASAETGIPMDLLIAQARQESSFNPNARGKAGEIGLFQIMPSTAQQPGFGMTGVDPATLTGPENARNNILFGARYLRARGGAGDPNNPAWQASALGSYNAGGDPNYVANVNRYRPGMSPTDPAASVTAYTPGGAQPTAPSTTTVAAAPTQRVAVGDSLAVGIGGAGKLPTFANTGDSPQVVLQKIKAMPADAVAGKDVVLSGGASNAPGDVGYVADQVQALKDKGAKSVTIVGVGNRKDFADNATNTSLQNIATQTGAQFQPVDPATIGPDGVHPTGAGYAALAAPQAPRGTAARTGGVDVAGPGAGATAVPGGAPGGAAAPAAPSLPPPPQFQSNGFTAAQNRVLQALQKSNATPAQFSAQMNAYTDDNRAAVTQYDAQVQRIEANRRADAEAMDRAERLRIAQAAEKRQEAEAKRAGLPVGYRLDDTGKAVRIDGLPPDPAVLEAQAKAGQLAKQQFDQENTLRDEFQKLTGDFRIVQTSYENIRSAAKANDGAGDMSLLYNYVRLLDPTSVVRESEFAAAAASGSFGERVQGAVARVLNGARMPETLRQSFIREGKNLYDNQVRSHDTVADQYEELARSNGLEPKRVVTRFARPQDDKPDTKVVTIKGDDEFNKLPSGTVFVGPDGKQRVKP